MNENVNKHGRTSMENAWMRSPRKFKDVTYLTYNYSIWSFPGGDFEKNIKIMRLLVEKASYGIFTAGNIRWVTIFLRRIKNEK